MIYRKLGKTGLEVSAIGLGCEYVWFAEEARVIELVHAALEAGINYIDIFVGTPSTREYFGKALKGSRDKVYLAGHLGCADKDGQYIKTRDEALCREFIGQFYEKPDTDYIDVLFLHNCDTQEDLDEIMNGWMYAYAKELKDTGKAGFIVFSAVIRRSPWRRSRRGNPCKPLVQYAAPGYGRCPHEGPGSAGYDRGRKSGISHQAGTV